MKVLIVGSPSNKEELRKIKEIFNCIDEGTDSLLLISNEEAMDRTFLRESMKELEEPILFKALPRIEDIFFPKERRTNHERMPSKYGRR